MSSRQRMALLATALGISIPATSCVGSFAGSQFASAQSAETPVPVERFRGGATAFTSYSGLTDSMQVVLRDSVAWRQLWQRINSPFLPQPPLPAVDFGRDMVVVTALGNRPSAGYDVVIERADVDTSGVEVAVRRTLPAAGCPVAAVETQPVDLARLPATDRPVRFRERSITTPCAAR